MSSEAARHANADQWIVCAQGHEHWGAAGAAGLLMLTNSPTGTRVLLQHRAPWVHNGDTWGIPSGALRHGEDIETGARREAAEEFDIEIAALAALPTLGVAADDHGDWVFSTVAVGVTWQEAGRFAPICDNPESSRKHVSDRASTAVSNGLSEVGAGGTCWIEAAALSTGTHDLLLHPGFEASLATEALAAFLTSPLDVVYTPM